MNRDCFAYGFSKYANIEQNPYCSILTEMLCKDKECPFYKTKDKYRQDLKKYPNQYYTQR